MQTIKMLRRLADGPLPQEFHAEDDRVLVMMLRAAGWIEADPLRRDSPAVVRDITFAGHAVLQKAAEHRTLH